MSRARVEQLTTQPWDTRVQFRTDGAGRPFAYRPNQVITVRDAVELIALRIPDVAKRGRPVEDVIPTNEQRPTDLVLVRGVADPVAAVAEIRSHSRPAALNHVFFAHP